MPEAPFSKPIGTAFIELQAVDSTNNYARQLIKEGILPNGQASLLNGTVVLAHEQTHGKGQMGKSWFSANGRNITMSILLKHDQLLFQPSFAIIACISLAVSEFFSAHAGDSTAIKWPNDLYWQDRKAGGILIESIVRSQESGVSERWYIIGIGININQTEFPGSLTNPVSLKQITGKDCDPIILAKELCTKLNEWLQRLQTNGFEKILSEYNQVLYKLNEKVRLKKDNRVFEATIKEVTSDGKLKVFSSIEEEFNFGEVTWINHDSRL